MEKHSNAKEIVNYSFLVVFANDDTIDEGELHMLERLALEDGVVDEEEKKALRGIFSRVDRDRLSDLVRTEIDEFCAKYDI